MSLGASIQGNGGLLITPRTASTSIGLGGGTGTLNLDDTELDFLQDGFSSITIGDATNTAAVDVDAYTFKDDISIIGSSIAVSGLNSGANAAMLAASGAIQAYLFIWLRRPSDLQL